MLQGAFQLAGDVVTGTLAKLSSEWIASMLLGKIASIKTAFTDISASAARAGAAAFASTAAIPIVGPAMAPAAGAAAYTGAMSFASGLAVASARGGYDIPGWIDPVTQLHAREMVLPAEHADTIRSLKGGGAGGGVSVNVSAIDARSFDAYLSDNPRALIRSVRRMRRAGARP